MHVISPVKFKMGTSFKWVNCVTINFHGTYHKTAYLILPGLYDPYRGAPFPRYWVLGPEVDPIVLLIEAVVLTFNTWNATHLIRKETYA